MKTLLLLTKVDMTGFFNKSQIKEEESAMNYIKRFQNIKALSVSVGNTYSEDQLMHTFLDHFAKVENILHK